MRDSSWSALVNGRYHGHLSLHSAYDRLGRMTASQDARGGVRSRGYDGLRPCRLGVRPRHQRHLVRL